MTFPKAGERLRSEIMGEPETLRFGTVARVDRRPDGGAYVTVDYDDGVREVHPYAPDVLPSLPAQPALFDLSEVVA